MKTRTTFSAQDSTNDMNKSEQEANSMKIDLKIVNNLRTSFNLVGITVIFLLAVGLVNIVQGNIWASVINFVAAVFNTGCTIYIYKKWKKASLKYEVRLIKSL